MRAMILAAGLGTRLAPLTGLRPKPAVPVRGVPLVGYQLALLHRWGFDEVVVNVHPRPELVEAAARAFAPPGLSLHFSQEDAPLGTGGGIRRVAAFLAESDPSLVVAADMLLDADLGELLARHRAWGAAVTLLLRRDRRSETFGSIGVDAEGRVRRIGRRFDLGGEMAAGVYVHATVLSAAALETLPPEESIGRQVAFGHLDGWLVPRLAAGAEDIRGLITPASESIWEPVGTPGEYLAANLQPPKLSYLDADAEARRRGAHFEPGLVIGAGARLGARAKLERAVVWDGETVPDDLVARDGVFAGGAFHPVPGGPQFGESDA